MSVGVKDIKRRRTNKEEPTSPDMKSERDKNSVKERGRTFDMQQDSAGVANQVAEHYNQVPETGLAKRNESRIIYMRNFNNWIKSVLINEFMSKVRQSRPESVTVLDLCCGKGGDLNKWKKAGINHLVCVDIAATSVEQCQARYNDSAQQTPRLFSAEFLVADCTRTRIRDLYEDRDIQFDIVSCQFSFHYCFESYQQTQTMLTNISECLKPGGYYIFTTLNSNELVKRWRQSDSNSFGNEVYKVSFDFDDKEDIPLFGAKYHFYLEGSVMDCPEFLVYFPVLVKMAAEHGLELVYRKPFEDFFNEMSQFGNYRELLCKMRALELYPSDHGSVPVSTDPSDYQHADEKLEQMKHEQDSQNQDNRPVKLRTITRAEWEAITLYMVCAFRKKGYDEASASRKRSHEGNTD